MADAELGGEETGAVSDGQETVYVVPEANPFELAVIDRLLLMYALVNVPVEGADGSTIGRVKLAQCKVCAALLQRDVGAGILHARRHQQERRRG